MCGESLRGLVGLVGMNGYLALNRVEIHSGKDPLNFASNSDKELTDVFFCYFVPFHDFPIDIWILIKKKT